MVDRLDDLTRLVRERYQSGRYGAAHLHMTATGLGSLPPRNPGARNSSGALGDLLAIPIVLDEDLPPDAWLLVDASTDEILFDSRTSA